MYDINKKRKEIKRKRRKMEIEEQREVLKICINCVIERC
jgi:hypothetical protein